MAKTGPWHVSYSKPKPNQNRCFMAVTELNGTKNLQSGTDPTYRDAIT